mmetsp:Transcript_95565/g.232326  ORF Transcript_95565/g.232326 Transcript_95565/m.232326 type:complete len:355 (+) Transcript_95565:368-1432(+)
MEEVTYQGLEAVLWRYEIVLHARPNLRGCVVRGRVARLVFSRVGVSPEVAQCHGRLLQRGKRGLRYSGAIKVQLELHLEAVATLPEIRNAHACHNLGVLDGLIGRLPELGHVEVVLEAGGDRELGAQLGIRTEPDTVVARQAYVWVEASRRRPRRRALRPGAVVTALCQPQVPERHRALAHERREVVREHLQRARVPPLEAAGGGLQWLKQALLGEQPVELWEVAEDLLMGLIVLAPSLPRAGQLLAQVLRGLDRHRHVARVGAISLQQHHSLRRVWGQPAQRAPHLGLELHQLRRLRERLLRRRCVHTLPREGSVQRAALHEPGQALECALRGARRRRASHDALHVRLPKECL